MLEELSFIKWKCIAITFSEPNNFIHVVIKPFLVRTSAFTLTVGLLCDMVDAHRLNFFQGEL